MLKLAFCETDPILYENLSALLNAFESPIPFRCIGFHHAGEFIHYVDYHGYELDIIICNIVMGEFNGIRIMRTVQQQLPHIQILFVSQYKEMVFDAYAVRHVAFIPIPVQQKYFKMAMNMALHNLNDSAKSYLTLASKGLFSRIDMDDILYFESNLRVLCVHTRSGSMEFIRQLESVKPMLDARFIHCHKSYIVNMNYIVTMDSAAMLIHLTGGQTVPISARKLKDTKEAFLSFTSYV